VAHAEVLRSLEQKPDAKTGGGNALSSTIDPQRS
jgi:hypothetical protein